MSTKQVTTQDQTAKFDPTAMAAYQQNIGAGSSLLRQRLTGNITDSPFFKLALSQGNQQANQLGQGMVNNFYGNLAAGGGGARVMQPFQQAMLGQIGRGTAGLRANSFWNAYGQGLGAQNAALQTAMGFQPLQTGQYGQQTQTRSGLGTWLPQAVAAGASIAAAPFTGGASLAGLGSLGSMGGGGGGNPFNLAYMSSGQQNAWQNMGSMTTPNVGGTPPNLGMPSYSSYSGLLNPLTGF